MLFSKTKGLISFAVTAKLICVFVFAYAKRWFSHDTAHRNFTISSVLSLQIQRQSFMLTSICKYLLPKVGVSVQHFDLAYSKGLTNGTVSLDMSRYMRKPDFCKCENKDADQLCGNRTTDQRLCFRYMDSTIPLLP